MNKSKMDKQNKAGVCKFLWFLWYGLRRPKCVPCQNQRSNSNYTVYLNADNLTLNADINILFTSTQPKT